MGRLPTPPDGSVKVVILRDGGNLKLGDMRVRAVRNTHFVVPSNDNGSIQSLSYRFDLPGRNIGFTGDTGPSDAVATLFRGVDLLVSEVIDLPGTIAAVRRQNPQMPEPAMTQLIAHLEHQHLTPQQAESTRGGERHEAALPDASRDRGLDRGGCGDAARRREAEFCRVDAGGA